MQFATQHAHRTSTPRSPFAPAAPSKADPVGADPIGDDPSLAASWTALRPHIQCALTHDPIDPITLERAAELLSYWAAGHGMQSAKPPAPIDEDAAAPEPSIAAQDPLLANAADTNDLPPMCTVTPDAMPAEWAGLQADAQLLSGPFAPLDANGNTEVTAPRAPTGADAQGPSEVAADPEPPQSAPQCIDPSVDEDAVRGEVERQTDPADHSTADPEATCPSDAPAPKRPQPKELKIKSESLFRDPKDKTLLAKSSTKESRQELHEARQSIADLRERAETLREQKAQVKAQRSADRDDPDLKRQLSKLRKKIGQANTDLQEATNRLERLREKNRDPQGQKETAHESRKERKLRQIEQEQNRNKKERRAAARSKDGTFRRRNGTRVDRAALEQQRADLKQRKRTVENKGPIPAHVAVSAKVSRSTSTATDALYKKESENGSLTVGQLEGKASISGGFDEKGLSGSAKVEGKATLFEYKREFPMEYPWQVLGEDMLAKVFLSVRAFVGAEGQAKIEGNLGRLDPKKPLLDGNHILAGAEVSVGAKASIGVGAGLLWQKKPLACYKARLQQSAMPLLQAAEGDRGPLGFVMSRVLASSPVDQVLGWLIDRSESGTVSLVSLTATGEGSIGAGLKGKAAIGFRNSQFTARVKAGATWGVGFGGELDLALDLLEGPLFLLLVATHPEFSALAKRYILEKIRAVLSYGAELWQRIWDYFKSDIRARELVQHRVHTLMPVDRRIQLVRDLADGWCAEADEETMITLLRDAKARGDLNTIVQAIGHDRLMYKLTGKEEDEYLQIVGQ